MCCVVMDFAGKRLFVVVVVIMYGFNGVYNVTMMMLMVMFTVYSTYCMYTDRTVRPGHEHLDVKGRGALRSKVCVCVCVLGIKASSLRREGRLLRRWIDG